MKYFTWIRNTAFLVAIVLLIAIVDFVVKGNPPVEPAGGKHVVPRVDAIPVEMAGDPDADNFFSTDDMLRGYCYASSQLTDTEAFGGFGPSNNKAHKVTRTLPGKGLFLLAQPGVVTDFADQKGMRLLLVNASGETLKFLACDSRLSIIQEAQDAEGEWHPIEYLPQSWCGNSYHHVMLKPDYFWEFSAPRYKGILPAKLRFAMTLNDGTQIHSNEFEGSVNLSQFTTKEGHQPTNIMDPYLE